MFSDLIVTDFFEGELDDDASIFSIAISYYLSGHATKVRWYGTFQRASDPSDH